MCLGTGPFTVFAPTNEAFNKLPAGVLANLLKPKNRGELIDLLGYHVVGSIQTFAHNMPKRTLMTLAGRPLQVSWHVAGGGNNHNYYYLSDGSKNGYGTIPPVLSEIEHQHPCPLESAASYLVYADVHNLDDVLGNGLTRGKT